MGDFPLSFLIVHDIMLSYEYNPGSRFFSLAGTINFLGADTLLYAGMIFTKGKSGADWQFMWRMYDDESIRITDFAGQMAAFLGVPRTQITLPEVELCQVRAVYAGDDSGSFITYSIDFSWDLTKKSIICLQKRLKEPWLMIEKHKITASIVHDKINNLFFCFELSLI